MANPPNPTPRRPDRTIPPLPGMALLAAWLAFAAALQACAVAPPAPDPARARLLAEAELARGRPEEAARRFEAILEETPGDEAALDGLARAQLAASRAEDALRTLDRLDAVAGGAPQPADSVHCRTWLAVLSRRAEADRLDEALALADRRDGGGCDPGPTARARGRAQWVRAEAARSGGRSAEALDAYRAAARAFGPDTPAEVYRAGARLLLQQGSYEEAVGWIGQGLELHPRDRPLLGLMVRALSGGLGPHP